MAVVKRTALVVLVAALFASACSAANDPTTADDPEAGGTVAPEANGTIAPATPADSVAGTVAAPSFPEGLDWLNTATPVDLESLRGKVVLLDFWTYGCINCIHIIPDLKRLEAEYPNELVVIGVHSAKFTNESQTANIREVVQRYELEHPVVNDENFDIWNAWGTQAWPSRPSSNCPEDRPCQASLPASRSPTRVRPIAPCVSLSSCFLLIRIEAHQFLTQLIGQSQRNQPVRMAMTLVARNSACSRERRKPTRPSSTSWYASNTVFW